VVHILNALATRLRNNLPRCNSDHVYVRLRTKPRNYYVWHWAHFGSWFRHLDGIRANRGGNFYDAVEKGGSHGKDHQAVLPTTRVADKVFELSRKRLIANCSGHLAQQVSRFSRTTALWAPKKIVWSGSNGFRDC
jgi:hypothetical protein